MVRRTAAVAIAGVLLLAGMVALRCSLMSTDDEPAPAPARVAVTPPPAPAQPGAQPLPAAPAAPPPAPARQVPAGPAAIASPEAPELPEVVQAMAPAQKHPPIANKALLRQQVAAVAAQVATCAKDAVGSGYRGSGTAVLTYMVTPDTKKQAVEIEQTGIEYDGTTIDYQPLLDCLEDTSKDMTFKFVPDTDGVFALRRVKLAGGKVVENAFIDFHYVR